MTEHVLECRWESQRCICTELRACEQRVLGMRLDDLNAKSFNAALDAAEQAVKAHSDDTHRHKGDYFGLCRVDAGDRCDITAALTVVASNIRALKEKP